MHRRLYVMICALLFSFSALLPVEASTYSVQSLGTCPGYDGSKATGISNSGVVIGALFGYTIGTFSWNSGAGIIDTTEGSILLSAGINDLGQTVSLFMIKQEDGLWWSRPYIHNADGTLISLPVPEGAGNVTPTAIDNMGHVVAYVQYPESSTISYIITEANSFTYIDEPIDRPWPQDASIWRTNGAGWAIGTLNGHAMRWDNFGNATDFGIADVRDINDLGQAVGDKDGRAVLWDMDGSMTQLPLLSNYAHSAAFAINNKGQIAGEAIGNNSWEEMAVVWNTVPEPSTCLILICGLAGIMVQAKRRRNL